MSPEERLSKEQMSDAPKYGSKSSEDPNKRHFFKWSGEHSGEGTGTCMYCSVRMKFKADGPRGGKHRVYSKDGKTWTDKEPQCHVREHAVAAKQPPAKKQKKSGSAPKKGSKAAAKKDAKAATAANKRHNGKSAKKKAAKKAPAAEAPAAAAEG